VNKLKTTIRGIITALVYTGSIMMVASMILATVNVFSRKIFNTSFPWAEELCIYLVVMGFFFSIPYLELKREQLHVELLSSFIKSVTIQKTFYIVFGFLEIILFIIMIYYGLYSTSAARHSGVTTNYLLIPKYLLYGTVVAVYVLSIVSWLSILFLNKGESFE
jgi:TRAP-type C4-dicarboxylate transport system permease small subunit